MLKVAEIYAEKDNGAFFRRLNSFPMLHKRLQTKSNITNVALKRQKDTLLLGLLTKKHGTIQRCFEQT